MASGRTADFDFELPEAAIARYPAERRDASRLMRIDRATGSISHHRFADLPDLLSPRDLLVVNDTKVMRARLEAKKADTGGKIELLLVEPADSGEDPGRWRAMATGARRLRPGTPLEVAGARATVVAAEGDGFIVVELPEDAAAITARAGAMPLPPYLGRPAEGLDDERYQTIFARDEHLRSVAAPTAGLHFTPDLLGRVEARGIARRSITLDVGPGTFLPVRGEDLDTHQMHAERFDVPVETLQAVLQARGGGGRVVAVGTTVVRTLESLGEPPSAGSGSTRLFIRPGFEFRWVGAMVTNFHLPRSTLLMLVSAFAGRELVLSAYREALASGYRFFSYGDAMLIE